VCEGFVTTRRWLQAGFVVDDVRTFVVFIVSVHAALDVMSFV